MRVRAILLAAALALMPLGARAADLVVWWEEGFNPEEDQAVREIVAAFERKTGKQVDLAIRPQRDLLPQTSAALAAGNPPDFVFGNAISDYTGQWAYEDRLVDLGDTLGSLATQFDQDTLERSTLLNATTGRRSLYALPMGRSAFHAHVWKSMLERAGFALADVPNEWEAFWSFWCEKVQPAVRRAVGRDDIWSIGLAMSASTDASGGFFQFVAAYEADYVTRDGRLVIDEPLVRDRLLKVLDSYTALYRKGCVPPDAIDWDDIGNNKAFLAQAVVMVPNATLSIPRALRGTRPEDYYKNAVTIEWPKNGAYGQPLAIRTGFWEAGVFRTGGNTALAEEFVRFLVADGWLAHWLNFAGERFLPPMSALLEQPFWLDPGDPHRMGSAMQFLTRPRDYSDLYPAISGNWRHRRVWTEYVWAKSVHRVVADGLSPEQAVDEAIARVKQILSE